MKWYLISSQITNTSLKYPSHTRLWWTLLLSSDVCLEAEVSPRRFDASPRHCPGLVVLASVSVLWPRPRLFCLASTRGIGASKLRYDIISFIYNFHPFIFFVSEFQTFKKHPSIYSSVLSLTYLVRVCVCVLILSLPFLGLELSASTSSNLPLPCLDLIFSCLALASSILLRSRENCLTHITASIAANNQC